MVEIMKVVLVGTVSGTSISFTKLLFIIWTTYG